MTSTARQVSACNIGMSSASTELQFIIERSHHLTMNNTIPVSMKEPCENESALFPISDKKQLLDFSRTVETQSSSHSMDERL